MYLSRGYDIWSVYADTPEEYFKEVDEIVSAHTFTHEQLLDIDFKKNRVSCDYCSLWKMANGMKHHKRLMEITQEIKNLYNISECCDLLLYYWAKMPEELDRNIPIIESMLDECLKECEEKEHNFSYLHFKLLLIIREVKLKNIEDTKKHFKDGKHFKRVTIYN